MQITADTTIAESIRLSSSAKAVYAKYRLRCPSCACRGSDKIRDVAINYGVDLDAILRDLNDAAGAPESEVAAEK